MAKLFHPISIKCCCNFKSFFVISDLSKQFLISASAFFLVSQSVASIGRMKAWLEILTLITTALVLATAVLAVRSKEGARNDRT